MKKGVFHNIASIYGLFYNYQYKYYKSIFIKHRDTLNLTSFKSVIDIGSGTGALCKVLQENGLKVMGVEPVEKMIQIAKKKIKTDEIDFKNWDILEGLNIDDNSFDISIASYVAHGMVREQRLIMYKEMARVTKHKLVIYDYNQSRKLLNDFVEWLEGGDYFNFIKDVKPELEILFGEVQVINVDKRAAWYIINL
ncbi:MAG: class I SAM-dependent methyltransferase [Gudongella sp.]|nr:class I SAM-dependent methyltransferase [Gudongella sp.]